MLEAYTNTGCVDAYRGAGKPEANFLIERLIDVAASRTGLDRVELRKRNILKTFPHQSALGIPIEGGRFGANLEAALESLEGLPNDARAANRAVYYAVSELAASWRPQRCYQRRCRDSFS